MGRTGPGLLGWSFLLPDEHLARVLGGVRSILYIPGSHTCCQRCDSTAAAHGAGKPAGVGTPHQDPRSQQISSTSAPQPTDPTAVGGRERGLTPSGPRTELDERCRQ